MARRGKVVSRCADEQSAAAAPFCRDGGLTDGGRDARDVRPVAAAPFCVTED